MPLGKTRIRVREERRELIVPRDAMTRCRRATGAGLSCVTPPRVECADVAGRVGLGATAIGAEAVRRGHHSTCRRSCAPTAYAGAATSRLAANRER